MRVPDKVINEAVRNGWRLLLSITFPDFTMRKVDLVCGEVRRPEFEVLTDTVLLLSLPAKVYPCGAVRQISRFWVRSAGFSEEGAAETLHKFSSEETALAFSPLPPEKRDNRKDNIRTKDFTMNKGSHFYQMPDALLVLFYGISVISTIHSHFHISGYDHRIFHLRCL